MAGLINNGHGTWLASLSAAITPEKEKVVHNLIIGPRAS
jgi:hypothetical protein